MPSRDVVIGSKVGLHGRPAAMLVRTAAAQPVPVRLHFGDRTADASSILAVLTLGARGGDTITVEADGDGAETALDAMEALLIRDLDAESESTVSG